jgi:hypothetical protein
MIYDNEWLEAQKKAMEEIAPILDSLEESVNQCGPVDMLQAYLVALRALREVDMDKAILEKFVCVMVADRVHHVATGVPE